MWFFVLPFFFSCKQHKNFNFASEKIVLKISLCDYSEKKKTFASTRADTEVSSEIRKSYSTTKVGIKLLIFQVQSNREISKKNTLWV